MLLPLIRKRHARRLHLDRPTVQSNKAVLSPGSGPAFHQAAPDPSRRFVPIVGVDDAGPATVTSLRAAPNPFNPTTAISYELAAFSQVSLKIYDTAGREVVTLVDGWRDVGVHEVTWDAGTLASGVYLMNLRTGDREVTQKLFLTK